ncbi:unnamed protein product [Rhizophagus irregularis]|nr:unnamed protein product [Rhizophagus irregularis]
MQSLKIIRFSLSISQKYFTFFDFRIGSSDDYPSQIVILYTSYPHRLDISLTIRYKGKWRDHFSLCDSTIFFFFASLTASLTNTFLERIQFYPRCYGIFRLIFT